MKKRPFETIVIIFMILFSIIIFGIFLLVQVYNKNNSYTLILKPLDVIECTKWKCKSESKNFKEYNNKQYEISLDGNYMGLNDLFYNTRNNKFYVFNQYNDNIYEDNNLLASKGKVKVS